MSTKKRGALIACAAATLVLSGAVVAQAGEKAGGAVHCGGINSCKGQGSCAGAGNACKGKNACKGQGFVDVSSAEECTEKGGKVVASDKAM